MGRPFIGINNLNLFVAVNISGIHIFIRNAVSSVTRFYIVACVKNRVNSIV